MDGVLVRRFTIPMLLLTTLGLLMIHPVVLAQSAWEEDGWLRTSYAKDRLEAGDEFGCYGVPGLSWFNDPGAVASACRTYIEQRLNASKWGVAPLSTYTPNTLTMVEHQRVASQGFTVHGDNTGLADTAWHDADDVPVDVWEWYNLGRRGGSLEQGVASVEQLESELAQGGLINLYWIGRINDATVRHDREVLALLDESPNVWLTTWGEAWSSWSGKRCFEHEHELHSNNTSSTLVFRPLDTSTCRSVSENLPWNVPLTWMIDVGGAEVTSVVGRNELPSIEQERNTMEGWWQQDDGTVLVSVLNGHEVNIQIGEVISEYDILGQTEFWNNHTAAVTVAGHQTTDLFKWSKRFLEDTNVRFTWLVQPRSADGEQAWIPYAVFGVGIITTTSMLFILGREGLGPMARWMRGKTWENMPSQSVDERSLDAPSDREA